MRITFNCDNGANVHSNRSQTYDLSKAKDVKVFGYSEKEWKKLSDEEKQEVCDDWAQETIEIYYKEET